MGRATGGGRCAARAPSQASDDARDLRRAPRCPTANTKLHRIWPIEKQEIIWPQAEMTDAEAESYPVAFVHYMDNLALRVGYTTPRTVTHEGKRKLKRDV